MLLGEVGKASFVELVAVGGSEEDVIHITVQLFARKVEQEVLRLTVRAVLFVQAQLLLQSVLELVIRFLEGQALEVHLNLAYVAFGDNPSDCTEAPARQHVRRQPMRPVQPLSKLVGAHPLQVL